MAHCLHNSHMTILHSPRIVCTCSERLGGEVARVVMVASGWLVFWLLSLLLGLLMWQMN